MLTQVEIKGPHPGSPVLPLSGDAAHSDAVQIKNIDGLGPVNADINTHSQTNRPGEGLSGISVGKRNIVLTMGLNPDWVDQTMATLRQILYAYFMPGQKVYLRFHSTHLPIVEILGIVESFDPNMFSKSPQIQISIICPDPEFVAVQQTKITGVTTAITQENPSGTVAPTEITYEGSTPTGFILDVAHDTSKTPINGNITVENATPFPESFQTYSVTLDEGYVYRLNTRVGEKTVQRVRTTFPETNNLLNVSDPFATWLNLQPGLNKFRVIAGVSGHPWELTFNKKYGGL